jgi:hypothetical protein
MPFSLGVHRLPVIPPATAKFDFRFRKPNSGIEAEYEIQGFVYGVYPVSVFAVNRGLKML